VAEVGASAGGGQCCCSVVDGELAGSFPAWCAASCDVDGSVDYRPHHRSRPHSHSRGHAGADSRDSASRSGVARKRHTGAVAARRNFGSQSKGDPLAGVTPGSVGEVAIPQESCDEAVILREPCGGVAMPPRFCDAVVMPPRP